MNDWNEILGMEESAAIDDQTMGMADAIFDGGDTDALLDMLRSAQEEAILGSGDWRYGGR